MATNQYMINSRASFIVDAAGTTAFTYFVSSKFTYIPGYVGAAFYLTARGVNLLIKPIFDRFFVSDKEIASDSAKILNFVCTKLASVIISVELMYALKKGGELAVTAGKTMTISVNSFSALISLSTVIMFSWAVRNTIRSISKN